MAEVKKPRVRFAPSPTGPLHIGGVRTALYNYLFARHLGGDFILRIEDTDSQRFVPGAEEYICESLGWCGLVPDEGPEQGGPFGPYRQSERREIYLEYALQLVESGNAYYAFDTPEKLDELRSTAESGGEIFSYSYKNRDLLDNSLNLSAEEVSRKIDNGDQWVIRFKMPEDRTIVMSDIIRGEVTVHSSTLDDKVIYKSVDALPTYHLANIVDDHLMEITHVIRGEEWLPSLPLHYMLYEALGWSDTQPMFAHLPLILKPTGKGKLSKRDGDKMGFPVFPLRWIDPATGEVSRGYREDGYFSEAFINMLVLLGWNPGTEQEIFSMSELIEIFSLDKVGKSGSRFDPQKSEWFNAQYMHFKSDEELGKILISLAEEHSLKITNERAEKAVAMIKSRAVLAPDLWSLSGFLFIPPANYDEKTVAKFWKGENPQRMQELREIISDAANFSREPLHDLVTGWISGKEYPMGQIMNCLRLSLVGASLGPDLFDICEFLGKEEVIKRIDSAISILKTE